MCTHNSFSMWTVPCSNVTRHVHTNLHPRRSVLFVCVMQYRKSRRKPKSATSPRKGKHSQMYANPPTHVPVPVESKGLT